MKPSFPTRHPRRTSGKQFESLEPRFFLSATKIADVPTQTLVNGGAAAEIALPTYLDDPSITGGTVIEMQTPLGNIPFQLTDSKTPMTVANFVQYIDNGQYTPTIFQRLAQGFIIQGGGTKPDGSTNVPVASLTGEPGISNTTGTIAMALSNGPDSGTNQWFINLANNTELDGTQDGGPFTVFGNVIDGGMTVVDAIANLPTIDGSAENPDWTGGAAGGNLPVINYTGPSPLPTGATIPEANLVTDNIVVVPAAQADPQYSAVSANPAIVTASVSNGTLTLAVPQGVTSGSTTVTAIVTDIGGETASSTFTVNVTAPNSTIVTIGSGLPKSATYKDADGTTGTIALSGPGTASINFFGTGLTATTNKNKTITVGSGTASIQSISTTGTTSASVLTITTKGGTKTINVAALTTDTLKTLSAKGVTFTGNVTSSASIGTLDIAGATGGTITSASIGNFAATSSVSDAVTLTGTGEDLDNFTAGSITGGTWLVSGSAKSITAGSVANWSPDFTGSVTSLTVKKGALSGTLTASSIGTLHINGSLNTATLTLTGAGDDLKTLDATGEISNSTINATGNLGNISALALDNSQIYAGVSPLPTDQFLPNFATDFATNQSIGSVNLRTVSSADSFFNSDIAAQTLGSLSLGTVETDNGGITTGVASEKIKSLAATFAPKHVNVKNVTLASNITTTLAAKGVELGDFSIKLF